MEKLIYMVYDRNFRLATYDFKEAIFAAFQDASLVVYDIEKKETLLDFFCDENTVYELKEELYDRDLFDLIPDCKDIYLELVNHYEGIWKKRDENNAKLKEKQDYEIYLKVKAKLKKNGEEVVKILSQNECQENLHELNIPQINQSKVDEAIIANEQRKSNFDKNKVADNLNECEEILYNFNMDDFDMDDGSWNKQCKVDELIRTLSTAKTLLCDI